MAELPAAAADVSLRQSLTFGSCRCGRHRCAVISREADRGIWYSVALGSRHRLQYFVGVCAVVFRIINGYR